MIGVIVPQANRTLPRKRTTQKLVNSGLFIKKTVAAYATTVFIGGDEEDRTPYLLHAMQALYQVSYTPKMCGKFAYL